MAKKQSKTDLQRSRSISNLIKLNSSSNQLLDDSSKELNGATPSRNTELDGIYNRFQNIVRGESNSILNNKSSKDNIYDYLAKNAFNLDPTNPTTYSKMEKLFTQDTSVSSYFMSGNSDYIALCDQIESICAYLYQLEESIDVIRDNVLACEEANEEVSMDIHFPDVDGMASEYVEHVKFLGEQHKIPRKLKDHITPKAIKFGNYYVITMPYQEIYNKMANYTRVNNKSTVKEFAQADFGNDKEYKAIYENASKIKIFDEYNSEFPILDDFKPLTENTIDSAIFREVSKANRRKKDVVNVINKTKTDDESVIVDGQIDLNDDNVVINGCFIKLVDARLMIPIKIFDHILGYYYFEHFDNTKMTTSMTDMMAGNFNFNDSNNIIDVVVDKVLKNLKYKDLLQGNQQFKSLILNSLMHKESRDNMLNIKFIPADYVVPFTTNTDEKGNGRPVLMRSLYFGRLYVSLLNFNITTLVTKSTDTEFYYMKPTIDGQFSNQISDTIMQMRSSNIDPSAIMNGDLINGSRAIYKRYFTPTNEAGEKPFEVDIIPGQRIDLHDELMDKLLKMTIGSTGVPAVMTDNLDEVDYAIMISQANIKLMRRCISIQTDFNEPITTLYKNIVKYSNTQVIKPEILETMKITLKKPRMQHNNYTADSVSTVQSTVSAMVETAMKGQNTQLTELEELIKEELIAETTIELTPSLPWNLVMSKLEKAKINAKQRQVSNSATEEE